MNSFKRGINQSEDQPVSATGARRDAAVIVNADDWGRDSDNTDRTLECILCGTVSSVSAMVFMQDSVRATQLAHEHGIDAGLHLNFTTPFTAPQCAARLTDHQLRLARFLRFHRLAPTLYNPLFASSFDYVVKAQIEEYERLFGARPVRFDGHHHMHLCANLCFQNLLPKGSIVRRNFSFGPGEKGFFNRQYRAWQDRRMARRHRMADCFFVLPPTDSLQRLKRIFELANHFDVEIETHPIYPKEHTLLTSGEFMRIAGDVKVARGYALHLAASAPDAGARA
jgi:predicted glycoside hydrolase/deacetylase ChbG (UPF0249 family)